MAYQQFDKDGNEINHANLQAKSIWCKDGENIEEAFVKKYGKRLDLSINPEKTENPFAPDLVYQEDQIADLKTQNTPFFKAKSLYGIDATYAVVFNRKDAIRYYRKYPDIIIYFWVEWHSVKFKMGSHTIEVAYINGVWKIPFRKLTGLLKEAPVHQYQQRKDDKNGNAKSSFVLDIRNPHFNKVISD